MNYFEVYVASQRYQKQEPLTYSGEQKLAPGQLVVVPFGQQEVLGLVFKTTSKPDFETKQIIRTLADSSLPTPLVQLFEWMQTYYPAGSGSTMQLFLPSSLLTKKAETLEVKPTKPKLIHATGLPPLTVEQNHAIEKINKSSTNHFLLHGETGSGKTRLYIERTKSFVSIGKSVLILTPEIALTPQLANDFKAQFGGMVIVIHSNITAKKRRENWLRIESSKEPLVIIGPRSAMFSPIKNLGLIVVDEFHEPAYKQEQAPRYQTVRVAAALAQLHRAEIIYGSATPPIADYYLADATKTPVIRLTGSAKGEHSDVKTEIINMADKNLFARNRYISDPLIKAIEVTLARKEQVLVYLNRRGTARLILCQNCGWQALCPQCDLPLTYHADGHIMRCHTCGFRSQPPLSCPVCASTDLQYRTMGTKALVDTLRDMFPGAIIKRFDTDLNASERLDKHFDDVQTGKVDILVGTQMLGKGLDLPKLSLVGVVAADTSLYLPDYTATERSYQLLHQVLGRVGRGHRAGRVVIQSYVPDNPVLRAAVRKDWQAFYDAEIIERKMFMFPPFCYLLKISASRKSPESAEKAIDALHSKLQTTKLKIRLSEPAPSFYEHTHGLYHWQLVLKATERKELIKAIKALPAGNWTYDLDPANLL